MDVRQDINTEVAVVCTEKKGATNSMKIGIVAGIIGGVIGGVLGGIVGRLVDWLTLDSGPFGQRNGGDVE